MKKTLFRIPIIRLQIRQKRYQSLLLCFTVFFLFADQNLMAPNLSAIAREFGFSDAQKNQKLGADISIGFFFIGGVAALFVGYLTDVMSRFLLFGFVVICGEMASGATYWAKNYLQLFIFRIITGVSIGGATPIVFSLLGDMYKQSHRIYASSIIGVAVSGGVACGQLMSGLVGPAYGWRLPFLIVAVPALLLALLIVFTTVEPSRGGQEREFLMLQQHRKSVAAVSYQRDDPSSATSPSQIVAESGSTFPSFTVDKGLRISGYANFEGSEQVLSMPSPLVEAIPTTSTSERDFEKGTVVDADESVQYDEKIDWKKVCEVFSTPSCIIIFAQGIPGCIPWGMVLVFLNDFLSNEGGFSVQIATAVVFSFAVGGIMGQLLGGWAGQRLYNRDPRLQCVLMGLSTLLAVPPMLLLLTVRDAGAEWGGALPVYALSLLSGLLIFANGPNCRVVLQNVCMPEVRGTAFAIFTLTDDIGKGLGPALVVEFIRACDGNRRAAFEVVLLFWLFCGSMLLSLVMTVVKDETAVQVKVRESLQESMQRRRSVSGVDASSSFQESTTSAVHNPMSTPMLSDGIAGKGSLLKYNSAESVKLTILPNIRRVGVGVGGVGKLEENGVGVGHSGGVCSPLYQALP